MLQCTVSVVKEKNATSANQCSSYTNDRYTVELGNIDSWNGI